MPINAAKWAEKLHRQLSPIMYSMNLYRYVDAPGKCPGAFTDRGEYDRQADYQFHLDNPEADPCRNGLIGQIEKVPIKGFYFDSLTASMIKNLPIGLLDTNEGVFIVDNTVDLIDIVAIEYPVGNFHSLVFARDLCLSDTVLARYAKVKASSWSP